MPGESSDSESIKVTGIVAAYGRRSDRELVSACLNNNQAAWEALIHRYQNLIFAVALKRLQSRADAEDVFQNVCLKLLDHLSELRSADSLKSWIAMVTTRECGQIFRRSNTVLLSDTVEDSDMEDRYVSIHADPSVSPEEEVLAGVRRFEIQQAMQQLSPECRKLLELLFSEQDEVSYAAVAEEMNTPVGSIGPRRARCLERLRVIMDRLNG